MTRRPVAVAVVISTTHASQENVSELLSAAFANLYEELTPNFCHVLCICCRFQHSMDRYTASSLLTMFCARDSDTVTISLAVETGHNQDMITLSLISELFSIRVSSLRIVEKKSQVRGSEPAV